MDKILGFIKSGFDVDTLLAAGGCCHTDMHTNGRGEDYCQRPWTGDSKTRGGSDARCMALDPSPGSTLSTLRMGHSSVGIPPALNSPETSDEEPATERKALPGTPPHSPPNGPLFVRKTSYESAEDAASQIKELMENHISRDAGPRPATPRKEVRFGSPVCPSPMASAVRPSPMASAARPQRSPEPGSHRRKLDLVGPALVVMPVA
jgi:hypothetical protein